MNQPDGVKQTLRLQARLVRRLVRRAGQMARYRRLSLLGLPVLFANSFPKSGTHLLTQVLQGFPNIGPAVDAGLPAVVTYQGDTGRARTEANILADLGRLLPGDIGYGHLHALPSVVDLLCSSGFAAYFILRDPRDVVVSHVHYVTEMEPAHIHHRYYTDELHSFEERLKTSILGIAGEEIPFPDIRARFEPYLGWLERSEILTLRFEDFLLDRRAAIGRVLAHAVGRGFPVSMQRQQAISALEASLDPRRSPTFRSGKAGSWRAQFSPENSKLFKQVAGDLLIRLGYEQTYDW